MLLLDQAGGTEAGGTEADKTELSIEELLANLPSTLQTQGG